MSSKNGPCPPSPGSEGPRPGAGQPPGSWPANSIARVKVRSTLSRSSTVRSLRRQVHQARSVLYRWADFDRLPPGEAVRVAYQVMLGRSPDPTGYEDMVSQLSSGRASRHEIVQMIRGSEEFGSVAGFTGPMLNHSIHAGRGQFVRSLPRARRILDLGGTNLHADVGAMVTLGYPYPFDELVIVDLPPDDRHPIYRDGGKLRVHVDSPLGPVRYHYHSMTDLSSFEDASFDLVYSGQSIEHVTPEEGALVARQVLRVLRPGGHLALDTPNGRVTRLMQAEFIDPDHKVEYQPDQLRALLSEAGFELTETKGLNYAGQSVARGTFDADEAARNSGLHAAGDDCYILAWVCRRPADPGR